MHFLSALHFPSYGGFSDGDAATRILGEPWRVDDHGEMLAADGDPDGPERAKCLYLAVAAAVGMEPSKLLVAMKKRARAFLKYTPKPNQAGCSRAGGSDSLRIRARS